MAMTFLGGIADRIVLLGGTLAGGCVPGFVAQYRQRVGGRLDQVLADMAPFKEIANRYHNGSLDDLIKYHLASKDPTFYAEGAALQAMVQSEQSLRHTYESLQGGIWQQLAYLIPNHDPEIVRAAWGDYIPSITLDFQGLSVALVIGVSLWVLFLGLEWVVVKAGRAVVR
jgi:hypothetical protein